MNKIRLQILGMAFVAVVASITPVFPYIVGASFLGGSGDTAANTSTAFVSLYGVSDPFNLGLIGGRTYADINLYPNSVRTATLGYMQPLFH